MRLHQSRSSSSHEVVERICCIPRSVGERVLREIADDVFDPIFEVVERIGCIHRSGGESTILWIHLCGFDAIVCENAEDSRNLVLGTVKEVEGIDAPRPFWKIEDPYKVRSLIQKGS